MPKSHGKSLKQIKKEKYENHHKRVDAAQTQKDAEEVHYMRKMCDDFDIRIKQKMDEIATLHSNGEKEARRLTQAREQITTLTERIAEHKEIIDGQKEIMRLKVQIIDGQTDQIKAMKELNQEQILRCSAVFQSCSVVKDIPDIKRLEAFEEEFAKQAKVREEARFNDFTKKCEKVFEDKRAENRKRRLERDQTHCRICDKDMSRQIKGKNHTSFVMLSTSTDCSFVKGGKGKCYTEGHLDEMPKNHRNLGFKACKNCVYAVQSIGNIPPEEKDWF